MKKWEVKEALTDVENMNDNELSINHKYIREVVQEAYCLIKNLERQVGELQKNYVI